MFFRQFYTFPVRTVLALLLSSCRGLAKYHSRRTVGPSRGSRDQVALWRQLANARCKMDMGWLASDDRIGCGSVNAKHSGRTGLTAMTAFHGHACHQHPTYTVLLPSPISVMSRHHPFIALTEIESRGLTPTKSPSVAPSSH